MEQRTVVSMSVSANSTVTATSPGQVRHREKCEQQQRGRKPGSRSETISPSTVPPVPAPIKSPANPAEIIDALERENENIVNRLQREITQLRKDRSRSRSQSTSSTSSSISRNPSVKSLISPSVVGTAVVVDGEDLPSSSGSSTRPPRSSFSYNGEESNVVHSLRKENDLLKKKLADLSIKLTEKESELDVVTRELKELKAHDRANSDARGGV